MSVLSLDGLAHDDERLSRALYLLRSKPGYVAPVDLVALVRSALVRVGYREVRVPSSGDWPTAQDWRNASCDVTSSGDDLLIKARPWTPNWATGGEPPDEAASQRAQRRRQQSLPGDPLFAEISGGHRDYRTMGQREAIRAVANAPEGSSVLAVLPTGSGKTSVITAPGFLHRPGLTCVVVPTVSLALDLERRIQKDYGLREPIAYHGGLPDEAKQGLRDRVRRGEQWIIVTSPEAAISALSSTLHAVAREGRLRFFAIDEAHIVAGWGGSFRPAFQALAGLRRRLAEVSAGAGSQFVTVLTTGTLDDYVFDVLDDFFEIGDHAVVVAQSTRPEIGYWVAPCEDEEEKRRVVVEAMRHLPRPAIVYTALVDGEGAANAGEVHRWLSDAGMKRVRLVTGESGTEERRKAVDGLRLEGELDNDLDLVVASSAFGLGVDIPDVRAVVHACIPESLDRLYQEVGRSGRDGRASISLLVHSPADIQVADRLGSTSDIGVKLAWDRWDAMRATAQRSGDELNVNLTAAHSGITHARSEANRRWNLHTLATMERGGMIDLVQTPPPEIPPDLSEDEVENFLTQHYDRVGVMVLHGDLADEDRFKARFGTARSEAKAHASASLHGVRSLLFGDTDCYNVTFAQAYTLHRRNGDVYHADVACGGCPSCRESGSRVRGPVETVPNVTSSSGPIVDKRLAALMADSNRCSVSYPKSGELSWQSINKLLTRLYRIGLRNVVLEEAARSKVALPHNKKTWLNIDGLAHWLRTPLLSAHPTAVVLPESADSELIDEVLKKIHDRPTILIHRTTAPGPKYSKLLLAEIVRPAHDLSDLLRRI